MSAEFEDLVEVAAEAAFKSHWPKDNYKRFKPGDAVPELYEDIGLCVMNAVVPTIRERVLQEVINLATREALKYSKYGESLEAELTMDSFIETIRLELLL